MANAFDRVARDLLTSSVQKLQEKAFKIAREEIAPLSAHVDAKGVWPEHSFKALGKAGLLGLTVPKESGGSGEGLLGLAAVTEAVGESCASLAICFGMHCVGAAVIAAKASDYHKKHFLEPIAQGKHITTLSLSESGTGSHLYISETKLQSEGNEFLITGQKQFVTNGGRADSYVLSTLASENGEKGVFNIVVVEKDTKGMTWPSQWNGFGMRGNSSLGLELKGARIPKANLLGEEGDEIWFVFEVVAPFFLVAMAGTYLGVAQAAFDIALQHVKTRIYSHSGERISDSPVLQSELAEIWMEVQGLRQFLYASCLAGDRGSPEALPNLLSAKAQAAKVSVNVCNRAMTLCGGVAYRENGKLSRLLRDARASHVMAPTTHQLKQWTGKALLGIPLL